MNKENVFISWSGDRSRLIADAFYKWLPKVVQSVKPWMSSHSIGKGSRGGLEMAKALDGTRVGISCLTPENLAAPWILYEAGCLSKTIDDSTRLCTYLLGGLENKDIEPPLSQFQHTSPNEADTRVLVHTINKAVGGDDPLSEITLNEIFDQFWPSLHTILKAFPPTVTPVTKRSVEDMVAEILEFTRSETNKKPSYEVLRTDNNPMVFAVGSSGQSYPLILGTPAAPFRAGGVTVIGSAFNTLDQASFPSADSLGAPGSAVISYETKPAGIETTAHTETKKSR